VKAILEGLAQRTGKKQKSFLIHLSGTGVISDEREQTWEGKSNPKIWDDIKDIDEINNLPENAKHHRVDRCIQDASNDYLKTAIVCPPDIYGQGYAVGGRTTFLVPMFVDALIKHEEAFYLGDGDNMRAVAHIDDVIEVFALLVGEALKGGGEAQWGNEVSMQLLRCEIITVKLIVDQGFYFTVTDEVRWKDAAEAINRIGTERGWLSKDSKAVSWNAEKLDRAFPGYPPGMILYLWGSNSRASSSRAKLLGWKPKGPSFWSVLAEDMEVAVKRSLTK
jgi:nucleoside-diphosphate-sugar epimerase